MDNSRMRIPQLPVCDCGRMWEALSILPHRQGAAAQRRLLAEGELAACPSGTNTVDAEYLGIPMFWNRNTQAAAGFPSSVRESTPLPTPGSKAP